VDDLPAGKGRLTADGTASAVKNKLFFETPMSAEK